MKVLVSGGTGLVGRYIVNGLAKAGYDLLVGGRTPPPDDWFTAPVSFIPLTLEPNEDQRAAFAGVDAFLHAAFDHLPGKYRGGEGDDATRFRRLNLDGTVRLFETAKAFGVRRCVFLSSRAVYDGLAEGIPLEETAVLAPTSLYGEVKLTAESALAELSNPDFVTASLRLTGVYGELRPNKWDALYADHLAGRGIAPRAGTEVHGRDVAAAVQLMLETETSRINGLSFNVSDIILHTAQLVFGGILENSKEAPNPRRMDTRRISALGWTPGGDPLLQETLAWLHRSWTDDPPTGNILKM
ncbi:MAG: NAD(P)-dependent oxidoreductase [Pseudorhizobium pelagicum]|uniref:NAD-dependent epimerase/dehydratase family protein n=1 Tax=Pseudorhizobium pelagicum TaxID=1509405 RepID=UPI0034611F90